LELAEMGKAWIQATHPRNLGWEFPPGVIRLPRLERADRASDSSSPENLYLRAGAIRR
jgi:hypothetical protein